MSHKGLVMAKFNAVAPEQDSNQARLVYCSFCHDAFYVFHAFYQNLHAISKESYKERQDGKLRYFNHR